MADLALVADIDALDEWLRPELLGGWSLSLRCDALNVLARCRAALISAQGEWRDYPAPYRDQEGDAQS